MMENPENLCGGRGSWPSQYRNGRQVGLIGRIGHPGHFGHFGQLGVKMELYEAELNRFVHRLSKGDKEKRDEIWGDFDDIVLSQLSVRIYRALVRLWHCKTFEEIAEEFTRDEKKRRPLTPDAIRKRTERGMRTIKNLLKEKHGNKKARI